MAKSIIEEALLEAEKLQESADLTEFFISDPVSD
jgi:hypothetical protein